MPYALVSRQIQWYVANFCVKLHLILTSQKVYSFRLKLLIVFFRFSCFHSQKIIRLVFVLTLILLHYFDSCFRLVFISDTALFVMTDYATTRLLAEVALLRNLYEPPLSFSILGHCWTKRQRGREVTVSLAILNLAELKLHPRPGPRCSLFLC